MIARGVGRLAGNGAGISGSEAPLKFRALEIPVPLRLYIGRLVFRALNVAEVVLAVLVAAAGAGSGMPTTGWLLLAGLAGLLAVQVLPLRPGLDRRARTILAGQTPPPSHGHRADIRSDAGKVLALAALGAVLAVSGLS